MPTTTNATRVAVTRDEAADGPLSVALRTHGLEPVACPVLVEAPPADPACLTAAARSLDAVDWVVVSSGRAVAAVTRARGTAWPAAVRTATVGTTTARAIVDAGVATPALVGDGDGAEPLWTVLEQAADWPSQRVLVLSTPGGRSLIADHLRARGAAVTEVEAYRMVARPDEAIARDFAAAAVAAVVLASARVAETLATAIGVDTLRRLRVVSIGASTSAVLARLGVADETPPQASFEAIARLLATS